jgi:hypothetical protein
MVFLLKIFKYKMQQSENQTYSIPAKLRKIENMHIVFWLFKDLCWCILFKPLAIAMILPTLAIAAGITYQNRNIKTELYHNLAVFFWIIANCFWMVSEFFHFDNTVVIANLTGKNLAIFPFSIGILFLGYYYGKYYMVPKFRKT